MRPEGRQKGREGEVRQKERGGGRTEVKKKGIYNRWKGEWEEGRSRRWEKDSKEGRKKAKKEKWGKSEIKERKGGKMEIRSEGGGKE